MKRLPIGHEEKKQLRNLLTQTYFFADLRWVNVDALVNKTKLFAYRTNTTIFKQGAKPDGLYFVHTGYVAAKYKKGLFKASRLLEELGPGSVFGEIALIEGSRRTASVKTLCPTQLFMVPREVIDEMLVENEAFRDHIRAIAETRKFLFSRHT